MGGQLLQGIQAFYREANACVRVGGEFSETFAEKTSIARPWEEGSDAVSKFRRAVSMKIAIED